MVFEFGLRKARSILSATARRGKERLEDEWVSIRELGLSARRRYRQERSSAEYRGAYEKADPLVTICIATFNRAQLLCERSLRSAMAQTYSNIEIIVVGDACTDETVDIMAEIKDPRVRFVNLEQRGDYPNDPRFRWMVAGTAPLNCALSMARGDFITHLDDDDEHSPDRVAELLTCIRETRGDLVYHPFQYETAEGQWKINSATSLQMGQVTTSSIFYHNWFRCLAWDPLAYRKGEPGDWNRLRKIRFLGTRLIRHPGIFLSHYKERNQTAA